MPRKVVTTTEEAKALADFATKMAQDAVKYPSDPAMEACVKQVKRTLGIEPRHEIALQVLVRKQMITFLYFRHVLTRTSLWRPHLEPTPDVEQITFKTNFECLIGKLSPGRSYTSPDHLLLIIDTMMNHRLVLSPYYLLRGAYRDKVINEVAELLGANPSTIRPLVTLVDEVFNSGNEEKCSMPVRASGTNGSEEAGRSTSNGREPQTTENKTSFEQRFDEYLNAAKEVSDSEAMEKRVREELGITPQIVQAIRQLAIESAAFVSISGSSTTLAQRGIQPKLTHLRGKHEDFFRLLRKFGACVGHLIGRRRCGITYTAAFILDVLKVIRVQRGTLSDQFEGRPDWKSRVQADVTQRLRDILPPPAPSGAAVKALIREIFDFFAPIREEEGASRKKVDEPINTWSRRDSPSYLEAQRRFAEADTIVPPPMKQHRAETMRDEDNQSSRKENRPAVKIEYHSDHPRAVATPATSATGIDAAVRPQRPAAAPALPTASAVSAITQGLSDLVAQCAMDELFARQHAADQDARLGITPRHHEMLRVLARKQEINIHQDLLVEPTRYTTYGSAAITLQSEADRFGKVLRLMCFMFRGNRIGRFACDADLFVSIFSVLLDERVTLTPQYVPIGDSRGIMVDVTRTLARQLELNHAETKALYKKVRAVMTELCEMKTTRPVCVQDRARPPSVQAAPKQAKKTQEKPTSATP